MKKCLFFLSFVAFACGPTSCLEIENLYLGFDGQVRKMKCKEGFGDLIVRKHHPQANIYFGYHFNENISVELGYESTDKKVKNTRISDGRAVSGIPLPPCLNPAIFKTRIKIRGPHLDVVFSKRISEKYPLKALGSLGVSSLIIHCRRETTSVGYPPVVGRTHDLRKQSAALRAMAGLQYTFDGGVAIRTSISFVNTGSMVVKVRDKGSRKLPVVPKILPKDSFSFGVGFVIPFC